MQSNWNAVRIEETHDRINISLAKEIAKPRLSAGLRGLADGLDPNRHLSEKFTGTAEDQEILVNKAHTLRTIAAELGE